MKTIYILTLSCLCIISFKINAQQVGDIKKLNVLEKRGSIIYFNNTPYTGRAIDFDGIKPDPANFRFDGNYINGLPNGRIKKWYSNHQLEFEENYNMGVKDGIQLSFYENGKKKEEITFLSGKQNGKFAYFYENGKLKKATTYQNGIPLDTLIKEFNEFGQKIQEEITRKNGQIKIYRNFKQDKISEIGYENNLIIYEGDYNFNQEKEGVRKYYRAQNNNSSSIIYMIENYKKGKLDGSTVEYNDDGLLSSRKFFKMGILDQFASHLVKYHIKNSEQILVGCPDVINHQLIIIRITKPSNISNSYFSNSSMPNGGVSNEEKMFSEFMDNIIGHRGIYIISENQLKQFDMDTIFYDLSITNPQLDFASENVKYSNGTMGIGYCCTASFYATLSDIENKNVGMFSYSSSTCPQGTTSWGGASQFFSTKDQAFNGVITGYGLFTHGRAFSGQVLKFVYNSFQVCDLITSIDERDGKNFAKRLTCKTHSFSNLPDNLRFSVYSENDLNENKRLIGTLKIKDVNSDGIKLKVNEGAETITSAFDNQEKIFIISELYK